MTVNNQRTGDTSGWTLTHIEVTQERQISKFLRARLNPDMPIAAVFNPTLEKGDLWDDFDERWTVTLDVVAIGGRPECLAVHAEITSIHEALWGNGPLTSKDLSTIPIRGLLDAVAASCIVDTETTDRPDGPPSAEPEWMNHMASVAARAVFLGLPVQRWMAGEYFEGNANQAAVWLRRIDRDGLIEQPELNPFG